MKKALLVVVLLMGAGACAAGAYFWVRHRALEEFRTTAYGTSEQKRVEVPQGSGPRTVGQLLAKAGVVSDAELFYRMVRKDETSSKLQAGEYAFEGALLPGAVAQKLVAGEVLQYSFTIPEGLRVDEVLPLLAASPLGLKAEKLKALLETPRFWREAGVPADSPEGFLFPDTYAFPKGATEERVLKRMVASTLENYRQAAQGASEPMELLAALTLASIVEKETGAREERPRISCVFHNRLKKGMKLQTDPTVLYALFLRSGAFTKNIRRKDLEEDHPYNTYTRQGLPPGPIAGAGKEAISAALKPAVCEDLFFVSRNDGSHVFCPTLSCHNAAVKEWQVDFFAKQKAEAPPRKAPRRKRHGK